MKTFCTIRVDAEVNERAKPVASDLGISIGKVFEMATSHFCDLVEKPKQRNLPPQIALLDALRAQRKKPTPYPAAKKISKKALHHIEPKSLTGVSSDDPVVRAAVRSSIRDAALAAKRSKGKASPS